MKKSTSWLRSLFTLHDDGVLMATSLKVTLTMVTALTLTVVTAFFAHGVYYDSLTSRVSMLAVSMNDERVIAAASGTSGGTEKDHIYLTNLLTEVKRVNKDVAFAYVMSMDNDGDVYFVADSANPHSSAHKQPGEIYSKAPPGLKNIFYQGGTVVEGPVSDQRGNWVSSLAAIEDERNGTIIGAVGIDIPVSNYLSVISLAGAAPLLLGIIFSAIFVGADHIRARRKEALRFRSELVSIASHELRTPLTGIRWGEETLMKTKLDKKSHETTKAMYDSTLRLQESIEDILQLANWQAGRYEQLRLAPTDITPLMEGIFATQKLPAAQKDITLEFHHDWPQKLTISCDAQRMKRVFNNLVSNATKYARPGTKVVVGYDKVDGDHVISITDHGIGIPAAEQSKVFAGFYRASNAIKHEAGGTGMGLYMSRTVIEQHGGKLWLKSEENKGTTAFVQLPQ